MKAISYSLFGYGKEKNADCFEFSGYLHGLSLNLRFNRLIYPDWVTVLHLDRGTYEGYKDYFDALVCDTFMFRICEDAPLTKAMLWRLKPIFEKDGKDEHLFSHVICRDLDSPTTYREAQAVKYWMNKEKAAHAITDSISHTIPMLGGMIGFVSKHFIMYTRKYSWNDLFEGITLDFRHKGMDQTYLNNEIYPLFAKHGQDSITQHYFKGVSNTYLTDFNTCTCWKETPAKGHENNCYLNIELPIDFKLKQTNEIGQHIGSAGWNELAYKKYMNMFSEYLEDLEVLEKKYLKQ